MPRFDKATLARLSRQADNVTEDADDLKTEVTQLKANFDMFIRDLDRAKNRPPDELQVNFQRAMQHCPQVTANVRKVTQLADNVQETADALATRLDQTFNKLDEADLPRIVRPLP